ncbi:unnamed protein product [Effrenium voratum]|nr:unnamed protein product [Effrenium voratum]
MQAAPGLAAAEVFAAAELLALALEGGTGPVTAATAAALASLEAETILGRADFSQPHCAVVQRHDQLVAVFPEQLKEPTQSMTASL